jgi:hypothetical protein
MVNDFDALKIDRLLSAYRPHLTDRLFGLTKAMFNYMLPFSMVRRTGLSWHFLWTGIDRERCIQRRTEAHASKKTRPGN